MIILEKRPFVVTLRFEERHHLKNHNFILVVCLLIYNHKSRANFKSLLYPARPGHRRFDQHYKRANLKPECSCRQRWMAARTDSSTHH